MSSFVSSSASSRLPGTAADAPLLTSFHEHYGALLRFLARRSGNPEIARELAHDTWLRLAQSGSGRTDVADPRAYVFTVAANLALDRSRRAQLAADHAATVEEIYAPDVADVHAHRQALQAVVQGLEDLPERARACFLAHRLDGVGQSELAQLHGVSVKTIERDVALAMQRVRETMERLQGQPARSGVPGRRKALSALLGIAGLGSGALAGFAGWRSAVD